MHDKFRDLRPVRLDMWESMYWQSAIPVNLEDVNSVIDFGSGRNLTKTILEHYGINCYTVDVSPIYDPDLVAPIQKNLPIDKADLVSCFQCLEHNAYEEIEYLMSCLMSYSNKYVLISLPYNGAYFSFKLALRIPKIAKRFTFVKSLCGLGGRHIDVNKLDLKTDPYRHHRWELGRPRHSVRQFKSQMEKIGLKLSKTQHNTNYPHHFFMLFEKNET